MGGFDAKRRVDFSDVDELMGSEAYVSHAAMSVAAVKKTSAKRLRKPMHYSGNHHSPS